MQNDPAQDREARRRVLIVLADAPPAGLAPCAIGTAIGLGTCDARRACVHLVADGMARAIQPKSGAQDFKYVLTFEGKTFIESLR
jgi:hypothetical protein